MRVLVFSDCHGRTYNMREVLETVNADHLIFLGDGLNETQELLKEYPNVKLWYVAGNCDRDPEAPIIDLVSLGNKRILFTHGHELGVNYGTDRLIYKAREAGVDIVFYGHTHIAEKSYYDGLYVINPGSISRPRDGRPSYAIIDIQNGQMLPSINRL